nr:hypothetical protein [Tanacetum cinerariifolium]
MIAILEKTEHNIDFHPIVDFIEASHIRQYSRRAIRIAQSKALSPAADEPASLLRDDIQGEAFPTVSSLDARQDRENIIKTSALPHDLSPRVTSLDADEGSMQQKLQELMDLCTSLQRQQTQIANKIKDQDLEISGLKARVKILKDKDRGRAEPAQEDAPIKGGSIEIGEEVRVERSTELGSNDTEEMANVLSSMEAANILTSGGAAVSVSLVAAATTVGVPTVSGIFPIASAIFTTASVVTLYLRRSRGISTKDKGKEKVVESERLNEQIARDSEIAKLHTEEELKMMIEGLDRSNEVIARYLQEYEQAAIDLSVKEKIELIKELEIHSEGKKDYWKIIRLGGHTVVYQFFVDMLKQFDREDLHQLWALVKETLSIRHATIDKEKELWVELKRLFELDFEDQLWTHTQNLMHDPLDWKLYDTCGVHHNNDEDAAFDGKEHDFDAKKPESEVILSSSSSAQSRKQDDNTKKEDKGKSPVESLTGYRDLNAEFEDCSDNSGNEVNAAGSIVSTVGQNSINITNTFSAVGPSNTAVSPTYEKSSFIDAYQLPDDSDMPKLEDITYSDDDVLGAEADFNNLESFIPEEPKRVHQALKDPS